MKIIISHDVDHLTLWEHFPKDLIIPKFFFRSYIEFLYNKINYKELLLRHSDLFVNKWNNIEEILNFNKDKGHQSRFYLFTIKSATYFNGYSTSARTTSC